jgi:hypothetical protein
LLSDTDFFDGSPSSLTRAAEDSASADDFASTWAASFIFFNAVGWNNWELAFSVAANADVTAFHEASGSLG